MTKLLTFLGASVFLIVLILYASASYGYVASISYEWFIKSSIPNLPSITWQQFTGFIAFLGVIMPKSINHIKSEYEEQWHKWITWILGPWLTLFGLWIIKLFLFV